MAKPDPWPQNINEGARMILGVLHALMTGPGAPAFLKVSLGGSAITIKAGELLDTAETLAAECMLRSQRRADALGQPGIDTHG